MRVTVRLQLLLRCQITQMHFARLRLNVGYWGNNGHRAALGNLTGRALMTRSGHRPASHVAVAKLASRPLSKHSFSRYFVS